MASKAYRIIKRYTYNTELAHGFVSYESADAFNRKHFTVDTVFGPEGRVEEYLGVPFRNEEGYFPDEHGKLIL